MKKNQLLEKKNNKKTEVSSNDLSWVGTISFPKSPSPLDNGNTDSGSEIKVGKEVKWGPSAIRLDTETRKKPY